MVVYFRSDERPGLLLGFHWDLERTAPDDLDWVVLTANLMEILDGAGRRLPLGPGADGIARFRTA